MLLLNHQENGIQPRTRLVFEPSERILDRSRIMNPLLAGAGENMRFFLAGIMQGSNRDPSLVEQDYRQQLALWLQRYFEDAEIYDPLQGNEGSISYDDNHARATFVGHNEMCREVDVVVAYVPEASMGTAIEMWEAYSHGKVVLTISPLEHNWVVRLCSDCVYPDMDAFARALESREVQSLISGKLS